MLMAKIRKEKLQQEVRTLMEGNMYNNLLLDIGLSSVSASILKFSENFSDAAEEKGS